MKIHSSANALYTYILAAAVSGSTLSFAADTQSAPAQGIVLDTADYGDINTPILARRDGIYGKAVTENLYIGDINADIRVGSDSISGTHTGIRIAWGETPYGVHLQNLADSATIRVNSQTTASGIDLGRHSTMGNILGDIIVSGANTRATGVEAMAGAHIASLEGHIDVDTVHGSAKGIMLQSAVRVDQISGSISVDSKHGSALGLSVNHGSVVDEFTSTLRASSSTGNATGISIEGVSSIGKASGEGMAGTLHVSAKAGIAKGLYITDTSFNSISGDLNVSSEREAIGIELANDGKLGSIAASADIRATLHQSADDATSAGNAYGIKAQDDIGQPGYEIRNIAGNITVTNHSSTRAAERGNAYGIHLTGNGNNATKSKNHIHESTSRIIAQAVDASKAFGVYSETSRRIYFEAGAQVKASSLDGETHGTAIYNNSFGITLTEEPSNESENTVLSGNLYAGDKSLIFESGNYLVSSDSWTSSTLELGSISKGMISTAQVTATDIMTSSATSLDFYVNSVDDYSQLLIEKGGTLDLSSVNEVNVYFSQEFIDIWGRTSTDKIWLAAGALNGELSSSVTDSLTGLDLAKISVNLHGDLARNTVYIVDDNEISLFLISNNKNQIPEPSTATLSLLALAGLMGRRRRRG